MSEARSIFTKETARRLDRVSRSRLQALGDQSELIPGRSQTRRWGRRNQLPAGKSSQEILRELGLVDDDENSWPRNQPAYEVIKEAFPFFDWEAVRVRENGHFKSCVRFINHPSQYASLSELVLEAWRRCQESHGHDPGFMPRIKVQEFEPRIEHRLKPLLYTTQGVELAKLLVNLNIALPPRQIMTAVAEWFKRAQTGAESTIVIPICPDYSYRATGDPKRPFEYTFEYLGRDVGLVARSALAVMTSLWNFFEAQGIVVRWVVAMADFEADSQSNLDQVGLTRSNFVERLRLSQQAFLERSPKGVPVSTPFITEMADNWTETLQAAQDSVAQGDYGALRLTEADLERIAETRRPLYERWHGGGEAPDCRAILDQQVPEYMATAAMADKQSNPMIFNVGSLQMSPFLQGLSTDIRPVLSLKPS